MATALRTTSVPPTRTLRPVARSRYYGFKLWYNLQDDPLMTPAEVLALDPVPDLVIYQ